MAETSKAVISVASVVSAVAAFIAIFNAGYLAPLNAIIIYEYTLPQLIWLTLIVVGVAVIAYGVWVGVRSPKDFLKDTSQYLQQVGMSSGLQAQIRQNITGAIGGVENKILTGAQNAAAGVTAKMSGNLPSSVSNTAGAIGGNITAQINEKLPSSFQIHTARSRRSLLKRLRMHGPALDAPALEDFPLPGQVARALQGRYSVFLSDEASAAADTTNVLVSSVPLVIVPARSASSAELTSKTSIAARRLKWTLLIVVIAIAASVIAWLLGK